MHAIRLLFVALIPETFAPTILRKRAQKLREETGLSEYTTEQELFQKPFSELLVETLIRPFGESFLNDITLDLD